MQFHGTIGTVYSQRTERNSSYAAFTSLFQHLGIEIARLKGVTILSVSIRSLHNEQEACFHVEILSRLFPNLRELDLSYLTVVSKGSISYVLADVVQSSKDSFGMAMNVTLSNLESSISTFLILPSSLWMNLHFHLL